MAEPRVRIRLEADSSNAEAGIGRTESALSGLNTRGIGGLIKGIGALAAGGALVSFLKDAASASIESEQAAIRQSAALRTLGERAKEVQSALEDQQAALQSASRFDDESISAAQTRIALLTQEASQIRETTQAIADFAAATGQSLEQATATVIGGVTGSGRALKQYGVELDETSSQTRKLDDITKQLSERFSGSAQNDLNSFGGSTERLKNAIGNLVEAFGNLINSGGIAERILNNMAESADRISNSLTDTDITVTEVAKAAEEMGVSFETARLAIAGYRQLVVDTGPAIDGLSDAADNAAGSVEKLSESFAEATTPARALVDLLGTVSSIQLEDEALKLQVALDLARASGEFSFQEMAAKAEEAEAKIEDLRARAQRLRDGLPDIGAAADEGFGAVSDSASEAASQLEATRVSADNARVGFAALGAQAETAAAQVRALTAAQFDAISASQGVGAATQAALDSGGRLTQGGARVRLPGGGSRLTSSFGFNSRSSFATISGGTFSVTRQSQPVSSDGRIGG